MAIETFVGNFALNLGTGNQSVTGIGFQPSIVIFFPTIQTADGVVVDCLQNFGVAISSTERTYMTHTSEDAQGTSDCSNETYQAHCLGSNNPGLGTVDYRADFVSMDANGFTINIDNAPSSAVRIGYWAIGGADLTNVAIYSFLTPGATGSQAYTGVGFQPDAMITFNSNNDASGDNNNLQFGLGAAKSATERWAIATHGRNNQATSDTGRWLYTDECILGVSGSGGLSQRADLTSFDADGFTLDWGLSSVSTTRVFCICFKGGQYDVGNFNSQTSTGNFSNTDPGFQPDGGLFVSPLTTTTATDVADNELSIGAASGASEQFAYGGSDENAQATTDADSYSDDNRIYLNYDLNQVKEGDISFVSFDAGGFTLNQNDADPSANSILYFVIGSDSEPPPPPTPTVTIAVTTPSHLQSKELTISFTNPLWSDTQGTLENIPYSSYSHELRAIGGYYKAKIGIDDEEFGIDDWIERGIGRHIVSHNPELQVIGEYFVNKITATVGALQYTIGPLVAVGNRLKAKYSVVDTTVDPPVRGEQTETAVANNTDSQALFGIIEKVININSATQTEAEQARDSVLNDVSRAYPPTSRKSTLGGANPRLTLDCLGYWHWLNTYLYNNSATGTQNLSAKIIAILAAELNGIFSTLTDEITTNTTQVQEGEDKDKYALTIMKRLNSLGDALFNRYNMGFYQNRKFRYEVAPSEVEYHQRISGNEGITTPSGGKVDPWNVMPGKWIFYPDFLVGRNPPLSSSTLSSDPRAGYIEVVKFSLPDNLSINGGKLDESDVLLERLGLKGMG